MPLRTASRANNRTGARPGRVGPNDGIAGNRRSREGIRLCSHRAWDRPEESTRLGRSHCFARLDHGFLSPLDRLRVLWIALAHLECALEGLERGFMVAGLEVVPAEVVQQRAGPVRGIRLRLAELEPA